MTSKKFILDSARSITVHPGKTQDAFTAGWEAHSALVEPTSELAKAAWLDTCDKNHKTRVTNCPACKAMMDKGPRQPRGHKPPIPGDDRLD